MTLDGTTPPPAQHMCCGHQCKCIPRFRCYPPISLNRLWPICRRRSGPWGDRRTEALGALPRKNTGRRSTSAKISDMILDSANAGREQDGRFSPGCSDNPAGKWHPPQGHTGRPGAAERRGGRADTQGGGAGPVRRRDGPAPVSRRLVPPCREAPVDLPLETRADAPVFCAPC
jgi:hypothetical protein